MHGEFADRGTVYYYSLQKVNLWQKRDAIDIGEMKRKALAMEKQFRTGTLVAPAPRR